MKSVHSRSRSPIVAQVLLGIAMTAIIAAWLATTNYPWTATWRFVGATHSITSSDGSDDGVWSRTENVQDFVEFRLHCQSGVVEFIYTRHPSIPDNLRRPSWIDAAWPGAFDLPGLSFRGPPRAPRLFRLSLALPLVALALLWLAPASIRRFRRRRRLRLGLCVRCGYDCRALPRCPECAELIDR